MHIDPEQQGFLERQRLEQQQSIARHLRSLPQEVPQPYDWAEFRRRAHERVDGGGARRTINIRRYAAFAAALVLVVAGVAAWIRVTSASRLAEREGMPAIATWVAATGAGATGSGGSRLVISGGSRSSKPSAPADGANSAERWLAGLPDEPIVVRVGTRAAVAGLEDHIAQLDDVLSAARVEGAQPARLVALEEQRARLVKSLVQVRYAETLVAESR